MSKLFDSLMQGFPVQTLLFWRTNEEIKVRRFMDVINVDVDLHTLYDSNKSEEGVEKVFVLDGQQRLQTLFCLYAGKILAEQTGDELEAYFDITSATINEETEQIYEVKFLKNTDNVKLPLFRIKDLLSKYEKKSAEDISDIINEQLNTIFTEDIAKSQQEKRKYAEIYPNCDLSYQKMFISGLKN